MLIEKIINIKLVISKLFWNLIFDEKTNHNCKFIILIYVFGYVFKKDCAEFEILITTGRIIIKTLSVSN